MFNIAFNLQLMTKMKFWRTYNGWTNGIKDTDLLHLRELHLNFEIIKYNNTQFLFL